MPQHTANMTDHALVVELMAEEMRTEFDSDTDRRDEVSAELERRYPGANERLAQHVTGYRMTSTEAVVWAGASYDESCRAVVEGPAALGRCGWVVEMGEGRHVSMLPCSLDEALNAVGSVKPDQLLTAYTITDAYRAAEINHPGESIAAYILDNGDGSYTVAV